MVDIRVGHISGVFRAPHALSLIGVILNWLGFGSVLVLLVGSTPCYIHLIPSLVYFCV